MPTNVLAEIGNDRIANSLPGNQYEAVIAKLANGYAQVWIDRTNGIDGNVDTIVARIFDQNGNPLAAEFQVGHSGKVSNVNSGQEYQPTATQLANGDFLVVFVFADEFTSPTDRQIVAQRISPAGQLLMPDGSVPAVPGTTITQFTINQVAAGDQGAPSVELRPDGKYIVTWQVGAGNPFTYDIVARIFNANGTPFTNDIAVNGAAGDQSSPDVAILTDNSALIVWTSVDTATNTTNIFGQRISAAGALVGGAVQINAVSADNQSQVSVEAIDRNHDGTLDGYVVAYTADGQDGDGTGVYGRLYDSNFAAVGGEFLINQTTTGSQSAPALLALNDGTFVVTWVNFVSAGSGSNGLWARRFDASGASAPLPTTGQVQISSDQAVSQVGFINAAMRDSLIQLTNGDVVASFTGNRVGGVDDVLSHFIDVGANTTPVNPPPVAGDDPRTMAEDGPPLVINVLANDTDDTGPLSVRSVTQPTVGGSVVINGDNTLTFTPTANFFGTVVFDYQVFDGNNADPGLDTGTVTITITPDNNDAPVIFATGRNPTFFATNNSVDLYANVTAVLEGGDHADQLVLTVTNVTQGADERIVVDGSPIGLTHGNSGNTAGALGVIGVSVSVLGTTATVTITPPAGFDATELASLVDGLRYQNVNAVPGIAQRVVTIISASDDGPPKEDAVLSLVSTVSPAGLAQIITVSSEGVQANLSSTLAYQLSNPNDIFQSISANGRFVTYQSTATTLVTAASLGGLDTNNFEDIYLRDRVSGTTVRASLANDESQANGHSFAASVSDDGNRVVFSSQATNLVEAISLGGLDTNGRSDIFMRDVSAGSTVRVNLGVANAQDNGGAAQAEISGNGQFVVFASTGTNLIASDTNAAVQDIFVRDLTANTTTLISKSTAGVQGTGGASSAASISTDGRYVAFESTSINLVAAGAVGGADASAVSDIFLRDTQGGGSTIRISLTDGEGVANGASWGASVSDGLVGPVRVAFVSSATNLVAGDTNGQDDIFVRTLSDAAGNGSTIRITNNGTAFTTPSSNPTISNDGNRVSFQNNNLSYVYDIAANRLFQVGPNTDPGPAARINPVLSGDGQTVTFQSGYNNIVSPDTNALNIQDIFAAPVNFNRPPTINPNGTHNGNEGSTVSFASNPISVADPDGDNLTVTLTVPQGTLTATVAGNPVSGQSLQISGSAATINTALQSLTYQPPNPDFSGTVQMSVVATDTALVTGTASLNVAINIIEINDNPTLTGLVPSITYEQTNAPTPLVIDGDVTFADIEGNFDGGHVVVSGLLPEDRVAVQDQGAGPGQILLSGNQIYYEDFSHPIGSYSGGNGNTFVVTLTTGATSAAADALIQNLTYADANVAPAGVTQDRTLRLDVIDAAGGAIGFSGSAVLNQVLGGAGSIDEAAVAARSVPTILDLDDDGDIDLLVGAADGKLHAFINTGGNFLLTTGAGNPFDTLNVGTNSAPTVGDLDGDGDLDVVVGAADGTLIAFRNDPAGVFTPLTSGDYSFIGSDVGTNAKPVLADVDGDGDLDLLVGAGYVGSYANNAALHYFVNVGSGTFFDVTGFSPFDTVPAGGTGASDAAPAFFDIDGDGDLDLFTGNSYGVIYGFRNNGGSFDTQISPPNNPLSGAFAGGPDSTISFADIDGDGDLDALLGAGDGEIRVYENTTPARGQAIAVHVNPANQAPVVDLDGGASGLDFNTDDYNENDATGVVIADTDATISDPDGDSIVSATATVAIPRTGDQLHIAAADIAAGYTVTGNDSTSLTIAATTPGAGSAAAIATMLGKVHFLNTGDDPGTTRTINVTASDGTSSSTAANAFVTIASVNDQPTLTATPTNPTYNEDDPAAALFGSVDLSTVEAGQNITSLVLTVTGLADGADEILNIDATDVQLTDGFPSGGGNNFGVNIAVSVTGTTATVTVTGSFDEASWESIIAQIGYRNASQNPTDGNRVVTITTITDDGSNVPPNDNTATFAIASTVDVNAVNDAPLISMPGGGVVPLIAQEDTSKAVPASITDVDADPATDPLKMTFTVAHGTLTFDLTVSGGITASDITSGNGTTTVAVIATQDQINATLSGAGLKYKGNADFNGLDSITITADDQGASGADPGASGTATSEQGTKTRNINVQPVNDAPVVSDTLTATVTEQTAGSILQNLVVSDVDSDARNSGAGDYGGASFTIARSGGANAEDSFAIADGASFNINGTDLETPSGDVFGTFTVSAGQISITFISIDTIATKTLVDDVLHAAQYTNTSDNPPASVQLTYKLNDGDATPAALEDSGVVTVTITPVNDPATITGDSDGTVIEAGGVNNGTPGDNSDTGDLDATDPDSAATFQAVALGTSAKGYGTYSVDSAGTWTYTLDDTNSTVQGLAAAATTTDTFDVLTADGTSKTVTITITGANDAATITGDSDGTVTEAGGINNGTPGDNSDTGDLDATDPDNAVTFQIASGDSTKGYGTYSVDANGTWTYTLDDTDATVQALAAGATTTDTFDVLTSDGTSQTVMITITGANDAATITGDSDGTVIEAGGVNNGTPGDNSDTGDLDATDPDSAATFQMASGDSTKGYGTYTVDTAGTWTYTLDDTDTTVQALAAAATTTDTFDVLTADGTSKTVTITITGANDAPTGVADTNAGDAVTEAGVNPGNTAFAGDGTAVGNVLTNDIDPDTGDTKTVSAVTGGSVGSSLAGKYGSVVINSDGSYTYTLDNADTDTNALAQDATATDVFTYTVKDASNATSTATLTITITGTNDAPVGVADTNAGDAVTEAGVNPANTPFAGDGTAVGNVLTNDTDPDTGDTKTVSAVTGGSVGSSLAGKYGSVVINSDGSYTYTLDNADTDTNALAQGATATDVFTYTVKDASNATSTATLTITITGTNDAPTGVADTNAGDAVTEAGVNPGNTPFAGDGTAVGNVLTNDTDPDTGDTKTVSAVTGGSVGSSVTGTYGSVVINSDGSYTYTLDNADTDTNALAQGATATDVFTYTVKDASNATSTATLTITITGTNDAPVGVADTNAGDAVTEAGVNPGNTPFAGDSSAVGNVLTNDTDPDTGDTKTVSAVTGGSVGSSVTGTYGSVVINSDGSYTYTLDNADTDTNALAQGATATDVFTYTVKDASNATSTATLTITITGTNDAPVGVADTNAGDAVTEAGVNPGNTPFAGDSTAVGNVLTNDIDVDALAKPKVSAVAGSAGNVGAAVTGTYGSVTINANGSYTYTLDNADSDTNALAQGATATDVFSYTVVDDNGATSTSTLTITITGTNDNPVANADTAIATRNRAATYNESAFLANDTDPEGNALQFTGVQNGSNGTVIRNGDGTVTFTPTNGYDGPATFTYTIADSLGGTATGTVNVTVLPNTPPEATDDTLTAVEDTPKTFTKADLVGNDTDANGDTLFVSAVANPSHGTVVLNPNGTVTYTPDANFNGVAGFDYTVSDGQGGTDIGHATINVAPVNDAPTVTSPIPDQTSPEDVRWTYQVPAGTFGDVDGDTLTYTARLANGDPLPVWLGFDPLTRTFTGTPPPDAAFSLDLRVRASDGQFAATDFFTLTITPVNDPPFLANPIADHVRAEDTPFSITIPANTFTDVEHDPLSYSATLGNGDPLPSWLSFDAANARFIGTPPAGFTGDIVLQVTANDGSASTSDSFVLTIADIAPAIVILLPGKPYGVLGSDSAPSAAFFQGTTSSETISVDDYVVARFSNNFRNSGDIIQLFGAADHFTVSFDGGNFARLTSALDNISVTLPVEAGFGITLKFETAPGVFGDSRLLQLVADNDGDGINDLYLGAQEIEPGPAGESANPFGVQPFASALLEDLAGHSATFA